MTTAEHENGTPPESRSSIQVVLNAKREIQVTVKAYAGDSAEMVEAARLIAVENFYETLRACGITGVAGAARTA